MKLCWEHQLYDLIIYIYNKGLHDYITPLQSLLTLLRGALDLESEKLNDHFLMLGQKILVYLSCCFAGHQYPLGKINEELVDKVKSSVFKFLFTKNSSSAAGAYPNITTLIKFDITELLNVLSLAFVEKEFEPIMQGGVRCTSKRQQVVDTLLEIMLNYQTFAPTQLGSLFTFIARQMAKYGSDSIHVNETLFEELLEYLTNPDEEKRHEERQQALLELHSAGTLDYFDDSKLLKLAEEGKFYRMCEILYRKNREYYKVFSCYWREPSRASQVFVYIDEIIVEEECTEMDREQILAALLEAMDRLVEINSVKFAHLIMNHFPAAFNNVAVKLQSKPEIQYAFLKGVFQMKAQKYKSSDVSLDINPVLHEKFIDLMCTYEPESVHSYLQSNETYRVSEVLAIVQERRLVQASAYLFEKTGDVGSAFNLLHGDLEEKVREVNEVMILLNSK